MNIKIILSNFFIVTLLSCSAQEERVISQNNDTMKFKELTQDEHFVIIEKGTERPFTGEYTDFFEEGVYACKQCGTHLYNSTDKFHSNCGWPSFDDEIEGLLLEL